MIKNLNIMHKFRIKKKRKKMVLKTKTKEKNLKMKGIKMNYLKNKDY
jgi:hypothetical protein